MLENDLFRRKLQRICICCCAKGLKNMDVSYNFEFDQQYN